MFTYAVCGYECHCSISPKAVLIKYPIAPTCTYVHSKVEGFQRPVATYSNVFLFLSVLKLSENVPYLEVAS